MYNPYGNQQHMMRRGAAMGGRGGRSARVADAAPYAGGNRHGAAGNRRIYVGNLSYSVDWRRLKDYFKSVGNVVYADVMSEPNGRSKGCGIVEFETPMEALNAIRTLNNTELDGRLMFIREDREDKETVGGAVGHMAMPPMGMGVGMGMPMPAGMGMMNYAPAYDHGLGRTVTSFSGNRIYVGNLSWDVNWQTLKDFFQQVCPVVRADVMTDSSGRSKGCGIVEFASSNEALLAINRFNNVELNGRPMFVREDREAESAPVHSHSTLPGTRVYVGNLSWDVSWVDLKDHFKKVGSSASTVLRADVLLEPGGRSKGCGIVEFASPQLAQRAIETMNNSLLRGRPIFVREDREQPGGGAGNSSSSSSGGGHHSHNPGHNNHSEASGEADINRALPTDRSPPPGAQRGSPGASKLYVGNLDWSITWPVLKDHFKQAGSVNHAEVIMDSNGRSKGFGIVEMSTPQDAAAAIEKFNNTILGSRQIVVREDAKQDL